jgi:phosphohistidine phosphatase
LLRYRLEEEVSIPMKLYLVRHATAMDGIGGNVRTDAERPLINKGRAEARDVAISLKKLGVRPDLLLSSPLVRARQTAQIFAEVFDIKEDKIQLTESLAPGGRADELYKEITKEKRAGEVCLFGHEPDMGVLAQTLLSAALSIPFKKAGVCRIDIYDCPPTSPGTLKWLITPKIAVHIADK